MKVKAPFLLFIVILATITANTRIHAQIVDCGCTNCPQFMPDNFVGNFYIDVQNASNPTLGQNGQGVCGVVLNFDHEYIGDLLITLTSPSGQTVTLVGPIGLFGGTDFSTWNITFVPCGDLAVPDPGFSATWNNNQPWGTFGNYTGSYYPNAGCLENFNSGPVNGTWTLTVVDGQAVDVGNFYDYEIIFCDPTGIDCFTCAANGGNLNQPDVSACEGSPSLNLNLIPTYSAQIPAAPYPDYEYTYVISGPGGVIQAIEPVPDLTAYPPGLYTVCGMSYYASQAALVPSPNGVLTTSQLSTQLNSSMPPFCGDISVNCVNVNIFEAPPDEEEFATICAPNCYLFHGQNYCQTGTYVRNLLSNQGCPYIATLHLTVNPTTVKSVLEFVCPGSCSQTPGFENYCSPGNFSETFMAYNGCDSVVMLTLNEISVVANIQPPGSIPCNPVPIQLFGTGSTVGAGSNYLWTASNGGHIVGPPNSLNVLVDAPGDYQLKVCRSLGGVTCCDSVSTTVVSDITLPTEPTSIAFSGNGCFGSPQVFSTPVLAGTTAYVWTVPSNVTLLNGQNTSIIQVVWNDNTTGTICVHTVNSCGVSDEYCTDYSPSGPPLAATVSGSTVVCPNESVVYTVPADPSAQTYTWTVSNTGSIVSGQGTNTLEVLWSTPGVGTVCCTPSNSCGSSAQSCLLVSITNTLPAPNIVGNDHACNGDTLWYNTNLNGTNYNWAVNQGVLISNPDSSAIGVLWNASGSVCLQVGSNCGLSPLSCQNVMVSDPPAATALQGDSVICKGGIAQFETSAVPGAISYTWTIPAGLTPLGSTDSTVLSFLGDNPGNYTICVSAVAGCGTGPQSCFNLKVLAIPMANAGLDDGLCNTIYSLNASPSLPTATGIWTTLSGPGAATLSAATAANCPVSVTQSGLYQFLWTESNGNCANADTVAIDFYALPQMGPFQFVCDSANEYYTVAFNINSGTAPYWVNGDSIAGNQYISAPIPSDSAYSFMVVDVHGCATPVQSGVHGCSCSTYAGSMSAMPLEACGTAVVSATFNNDAVLDGNDTFAYILHDSPGATLGTIFAQNHTGVFSIQAGMVPGNTYYISVIAGNDFNGEPLVSDPCFSIAVGQPVVFHAIPQPNAGLNASFCASQGNLLAANTNYTGVWSFLSGPGAPIIGSPSNASSSVAVNSFGIYNFVWTETNAICGASDTVALQFNSLPGVAVVTETCNGTNTDYTLAVSIASGLAPYQVNGLTGTQNGTLFNSDFIPSGQAYVFNITDANGCVSPDFSGTYSCSCATQAGTMDLTPLVFCAGETAVATWNNDGVVDQDDIVLFILHDQAGPQVGTIIATNTVPTFDFTANVQTGITYYISVIAGNGSGGQIDFSDPCFDISAGTPIMWKPLPNASMSGDAVICVGSSAQLLFSGTGAYPLTLHYNDDAGNNLVQTISGPNAISLTVTPGLSTTYQLNLVEDGTLPTCSLPLNQQVTIQVSELVDAGQAALPVSFCADANYLQNLTELLIGADSGGTWSETSPVLSTGNAFSAASGSFQVYQQQPGAYTFRYSLLGNAPCPNDQTEVSVIVNPVPVANAGPDLTLDCNTPSGVLNGSSSIGQNLVYQWYQNGVLSNSGNTASLSVDTSGIYRLEVKNAFGCQDTDEANVQIENNTLHAEVELQPIRCYGDDNGILVVKNIQGGLEPVYIALNGGVLGTQSIYTQLAPGKYKVFLQDAKGCEWASDTFELLQPPQVVADLGPDLKITLGEAAKLHLNVSVPLNVLDTIIWAPLLDTLNAGKPYQEFIPDYSQLISVSIADAMGCSDESSVLIIVEKSRNVYVPNIFNPSTHNLTIYGGKEVDNVEFFRIYDRWGELVYEAPKPELNSELQGWNGTQNGANVMPGVYVWYAYVRFVDGYETLLSGEVTVVR